jgi:hypothetical protein
MTTKANLPAAGRDDEKDDGGDQGSYQGDATYMAAGSGIPEVKTILSGFVIPHLTSTSSWSGQSVPHLQWRLACALAKMVLSSIFQHV